MPSCFVVKCFSLLLLISVFQVATSFNPIGSVCETGSDCGKNAGCVVPYHCGRGRCTCLTTNGTYRPLKSSPSDCGLLLNLGDDCTNADENQINTAAGHVCRNGNITCAPRFLQQFGTCTSKPIIKNYGEFCNDTSQAFCNNLIGLVCNFMPDDPDEKTCQCPPGMRITVDAKKYPFGSLCTFSEFQEQCDDSSQCQSIYNDAATNWTVCRSRSCGCNSGFSPKPYFTGWDSSRSNTVFTKKFCVPDSALTVGPAANCTLFGPGMDASVRSVICQDGLVCYNCPEFDSARNPRTGKCLAVSIRQVNGSTRNFLSGSFLVVTVLLINRLLISNLSDMY